MAMKGGPEVRVRIPDPEREACLAVAAAPPPPGAARSLPNRAESRWRPGRVGRPAHAHARGRGPGGGVFEDRLPRRLLGARLDRHLRGRHRAGRRRGRRATTLSLRKRRVSGIVLDSTKSTSQGRRSPDLSKEMSHRGRNRAVQTISRRGHHASTDCLEALNHRMPFDHYVSQAIPEALG
jgi:hypothetical protein